MVNFQIIEFKHWSKQSTSSVIPEHITSRLIGLVCSLFWNLFHYCSVQVQFVVSAQGGGRCQKIHTVQIAVHSAKSCCTATTMAFASIEQKLSQVCDPQLFFCVHNADKAKQPYINKYIDEYCSWSNRSLNKYKHMEYQHVEIPLNEQASTSQPWYILKYLDCSYQL